MEKVIFTKTGSTEKFIEWVERFKGDISKDSLIIEIDIPERKFVAKTFSPDKSLVRFSQISFAESNLEIDEASIANTNFANERVLIGLFAILPKFIKAIKTVDSSEKFVMEIDANQMTVAEKNRWCAISVRFKSKKLNMMIPGASLSTVEMVPLDDEIFDNKIWVAPEPISLKISGEELENLLCISDIFTSVEKLKNFMEFYTKVEDGKKVLMVRDPEQQSYDYLIGEVEGFVDAPDFSFKIYRDRFLIALKNAIGDTTLTISTKLYNRILIELGNGDTKTIIARVNPSSVK